MSWSDVRKTYIACTNAIRAATMLLVVLTIASDLVRAGKGDETPFAAFAKSLSSKLGTIGKGAREGLFPPPNGGMWSLVERPAGSSGRGLSAFPSMNDVRGLREEKEAVRRAVVYPLRYRQVFFDPATPSLLPPRGVLLHGPPGTGKTLLARACAKESGASFLALSAATLENKWWGETPKLLQEAFAVARAASPCIVFMDEVDGIGRARTETDLSCVYTLKCELLRHLDDAGAPTPEGRSPAVIVVACTNYRSSLDPALLRRFPLQVEVRRPDAKGREDILRKETDRLGRGTSVSASLLRDVAKSADGANGADMTNMAKAACSRLVWETIQTGCRNTEEANAFFASHPNGASLLSSLGKLERRHFFPPPGPGA